MFYLKMCYLHIDLKSNRALQILAFAFYVVTCYIKKVHKWLFIVFVETSLTIIIFKLPIIRENACMY